MNIFDFTSIKETGMSNWAGLYSQNIVAGKTDSAGFQAVLDQNMGHRRTGKIKRSAGKICNCRAARIGGQTGK